MVAASITVDFVWLAHGEGLDMPRAYSAGAAGRDLCAALPPGETVVIAPGRWHLIPCGFAIALPEGFEAQIRPRSGLAAKYGVTLLNAPGTIDADYRGEVKINLINHGERAFSVRRGDRIAQMTVAALQPAEFRLVTMLGETRRGTDGFGSTGHAAAE